MSITADIQRLEPGALIRLYELDLSTLGGDILRFHGHTQAGSITWRGHAYDPWAIEATEFQRTGEAQQPAPTLSVGNIGQDEAGNAIPGVISSLCLALNDLVGAVLTVRETFAHYLDAENFPQGNPAADPEQELPLEVWIVEQKVSETAEVLTFELSNSLSFDGTRLPARQITAGVCSWLWIGGYRGPYCGYTGNRYLDAQDNVVTDPALDRCGGRVSSCKGRFGEYQVINFGGFPAADRLR
ncbi:Phage minor tail protein [plant metagenome]|uniref:Phage minor tail protein n=1 Tax=plant metagenome TaxID=1297885 RepID=A0A484U0X0_9ZZZZ